MLEGYAGSIPIKRIAGELLRSSFRAVPDSLDDSHHPLQLWNRVVELYSKRHLSFCGDKLIALEGLAAKSHKRFSSNYLAGLWQEFLPFQLLWMGIGACIPSLRVYRAPTWSWAAIDVEIAAHETRSQCVSLIELIDGHVHPAGQSLYGQVESGYIKIKCCIIPTRLIGCKPLLPIFPTDAVPVVSLWDYPPKSEDKQEIFYLVPVCGGIIWSLEDSEEGHSSSGLIIAEVGDRSGYFMRGIFRPNDDEPVGQMMRYCREFVDGTNDSGLAPVGDKSGMFTITII